MTMAGNVEAPRGGDRAAEQCYRPFGGGLPWGLGFHPQSVGQGVLAGQAKFASFHDDARHATLAGVSIHETIRRLRKSRGLSHAALAKLVNELDPASSPISRQTVQHWEKTEGGNAPRRERLPVVAQALGVSVEELLGGPKPASVAGLSHYAGLAAMLLEDLPSDEERRRVYAMWSALVDFRQAPQSDQDTDGTSSRADELPIDGPPPDR